VTHLEEQIRNRNQSSGIKAFGFSNLTFANFVHVFKLCGFPIQFFVSKSCRKFEIINSLPKRDRPCGLVVRLPGYTTEMYRVSCEVRTEFILYYVEEIRPPLRSSGQSSWLLQIKGSGFDPRRYQIF
jgi:hypothetical protein